ncbi:MAG: hypothetical protein JNM80_14570 [Phycisphaerae bacterium]|nr:hypothetical protein [Phycisphaerae bacterium]
MSTSRLLIGAATILALEGSASAQAFFSTDDADGPKRVVVRKVGPMAAAKSGERQVRVEVRDGQPRVWVSGDDATSQKRIIVRKIEGQLAQDCDGEDCDDGDDGADGATAPRGQHEIHVFGMPGGDGKTMTFRASRGHDGTIQLRALGNARGGGKAITLRGLPGGEVRGFALGGKPAAPAKGACCEACGRPFEHAGRAAPAQPKVFRFDSGDGNKGEVRILRRSEGQNRGQLHEHLARLGHGTHGGDVKVQGKIIIVGPDGTVTERELGSPKRGPRSEAVPGFPLETFEVRGLPLGEIPVVGQPLDATPVQGVRIAPVIEPRKTSMRGGVL